MGKVNFLFPSDKAIKFSVKNNRKVLGKDWRKEEEKCSVVVRKGSIPRMPEAPG